MAPPHGGAPPIVVVVVAPAVVVVAPAVVVVAPAVVVVAPAVVVVAPAVVVVAPAVVVVAPAVVVVAPAVVVVAPAVVVVAPAVVEVVVVVAPVVVVVSGGFTSPAMSIANASALASIALTSPVVVQPPLASAFEKLLVSFDWAFEMLLPSLAGSGFLQFLPTAFIRSAAFFPAAFAFVALQASAGLVPAYAAGMASANNATAMHIVRLRAMSRPPSQSHGDQYGNGTWRWMRW
jgi:hypothetical protein